MFGGEVKGHLFLFYFTFIHSPSSFHHHPPQLCSGSFANLQKETIIFVLSVRPSVRMEQLGSHWTDFHE
jgi:hypothetical protein